MSSLKVAAFFKKVAPTEPVLYDGWHDGVFVFHVRADDPNLQRHVVRGSKLLYTTSINGRRCISRNISTTAELMEWIRTRSGCRWIAAERGAYSERFSAARILRNALKGRQFEYVRWFPIQGRGIQGIDIYRVRFPVRAPDRLEFQFPHFDPAKTYRLKPIKRRDRDGGH